MLGDTLVGNRLGLQVIITSSLAFKALPAIMFGGLDSVAGAIIGGLVVGVLEKMASGYIDPKIAEITPYIILLFAQNDLMSPLGGSHGKLTAGRTGAHHQHLLGMERPRDLHLRFSSRDRIYCTTDR